MLTVAINTSTRKISVALLKDGKPFGEKSWNSRKDEAEKLLPNIERLLKKEKKQWKDVREVFVVSGPGPFTGLRVGVTTANALAWSTGSTMIAADVFEYLRAMLPSKVSRQTAVLVKAGGDYMAVHESGTNKHRLVTSKNLPGILKKTGAKKILAEMAPNDLSVLKKMMKERSVAVSFVEGKELKSFGAAAAEIVRGKRTRSKSVGPRYLQKPHITRSKKPSFV